MYIHYIYIFIYLHMHLHIQTIVYTCISLHAVCQKTRCIRWFIHTFIYSTCRERLSGDVYIYITCTYLYIYICIFVHLQLYTHVYHYMQYVKKHVVSNDLYIYTHIALDVSSYLCFCHSIFTVIVCLQHTATHCNTLQHTATHCNTLQHTASHCITLHHTASHCNTLQHTATHCNALQHTPIPRVTTV